MLDRTGVATILIRATNWLGDAVMTTPALAALRSAFPKARLKLLARPLVAELLANHPCLDEILVYENSGRHAGMLGKFRLAAELRQHRFDLAILLQNAFDAAIITWLAGIPRRLGYRTDGRGILLTHGCPVNDELRHIHQVDYYLALLGHFGIGTDRRQLSLYVTQAEEQALTVKLAKAGIDRDDFLLAINPGATYGAAKRWYPDRFAEVARTLSVNWGAKLVLLGGPGEVAIAREIAAALSGAAINLAGTLSVRELMVVIKRSDFMITNDSGPMHIAAAFAVPLVAIFGPTDHSTTSPFAADAAVVRQSTECAPCLLRECPTDHRCMVKVTVADVVEAAMELKERINHH